MIESAGGIWWLIIDVVFVAALGLAIAYATLQWRRRNRSLAARQARERATERLYEQPEAEAKE